MSGFNLNREDNTTPTGVEARLESMFPIYNFRAVLVLLLATFVVMAVGPTDRVGCGCSRSRCEPHALAAVLASRSGRVLFRITAIVAVARLRRRSCRSS